MASQEDVRRIALLLPEAFQEERGFAFAVLNKGKRKGFAWVWNERIQPKKPRVPRPDVIALRVADEDEKEMLLAADAEKFFTEPHYNGFPAILVRLPAIDVEELTELITDAWRCLAPSALVEDFDARGEPNV
ncbi:MAG TPA: MmcQ/YjbR family DNA-binding protein [Chthonomonadaceae bacterium]|nr:MmcQ/YjbR family DNA-binding protein [Chthonomonadaceae bacterium]